MATTSASDAHLVLCARVLTNKESAFAQWNARWHSAVLQSAGARSFEDLPPTRDQEETIVVARFSSADALQAWRHGDSNRALLEEARPLVEGGVLMQLTGKAAIEYVTEHSATEVVITQIKPGSEEAYRAFADRILKAQATFPGYLGSFVQPPQNKETGWTTVLRYDTLEHLDAWMTSPQRAALLQESESLILGFEAQRVDTSFPGWVPANPITGKPPSIWKTAALVLLTLFPVIMLELKFLNPSLRWLHPALATFLGNAISVLITTWPLMPLAIRLFQPWLFPENHPRALVRAMPLFLILGYLIEIVALWRLL